MTTSHQAIVETYRGKTLGQTDYTGHDYKFTVDDFTDVSRLRQFLYDLDTFEVSLTPEGLQFLDEYYGLDAVVEMILKENRENHDQFKFKKREEILSWLNRLGYPTPVEESND